jgi:micrococcal nuclease
MLCFAKEHSVADFKEWRALPKQGRNGRNGGQSRHKQRSSSRKHLRKQSEIGIDDVTRTAGFAVFVGLAIASIQTDWSAPVALGHSPGQSVMRSFSVCHSGGGTNCVVDGDTFWMDGRKIRIADIDTPETHPPRCAEEAELGKRATHRLQQLLNAGPLELQSIDRDTDKYGRQLRIVMRNGQSLGDTLVAEGLAREWEGSRRPWCSA